MIVGPFEATVSEYDGEPVILDFCGEEFKVAMGVGGMPLMEFAYSAKSGLDTSEMDGLAAMYSMIEDCLEEGEWDRFRATAKKHKSPITQLMKVATSIYAALSNRPLDTGKSSQDGLADQSTGDTSDSDATSLSVTSTELASKKPANKKAKATG